MELRVKNMMKGDRIIWAVLILLSLASMLIVYSATGALAYREAGGNTFHYLVRQIVFISLGFAAILIMVNIIPVKLYSIVSRLMVWISIGLLGLAIGMKMTNPVSAETGRTLNLGFMSFQPAEIAKLSLIMYAAKMLGIRQSSKEELKIAFYNILIYSVIICGMIFLSNFSTAVLLFGTIMCMCFIGRVPVRYLFMVLAVGAGLIALIYFVDFGENMEVSRLHTIRGRIERFMHGDPAAQEGITQADYAKLAIYNGGIIGKGPGNSEVANYISQAYNDFIFAIIVEEYGLMGGIAILMLYLILFFRGINIVKKTNRTFPAFLVTGLTLLLVFQALINIGVSAGVLPVTGQPLPWISMGGTSLIFTSIAFGCILSVSYQNQKNKVVEVQPVAAEIDVPDEDHEM
ncbi:MAG: FtsW/RodA/SpoVE family cell cycle protein [Prolixibacteraceae bacterium]|nr:FtsW/RodA/SpoVE family cell cycle protein [Prolixibacteraceae bacterium]